MRSHCEESCRSNTVLLGWHGAIYSPRKPGRSAPYQKAAPEADFAFEAVFFTALVALATAFFAVFTGALAASTTWLACADRDTSVNKVPINPV